MGTKTGNRNKANLTGFTIKGNQGYIAQLLHPYSASRDAGQVAPLLRIINNKLGKEVKLVISGGGLVEITKSSEEIGIKDKKSEEMLNELIKIVEKEIEPISTLMEKFDRDYIIGVDVIIDDEPVGQFAVVYSKEKQRIIWKSYPIGNEDQKLAGFGTSDGRNSPRIVSTSIGKGIILVCHDSQAYNHRNRANVSRAKHPTPRKMVMDKMDDQMDDHKPEWAFNLIHWVDERGDLTTFNTSYKQIYNDIPWHPNVIGAFGYEYGIEDELEELAKIAKYPKDDGIVIVLK